MKTFLRAIVMSAWFTACVLSVFWLASCTHNPINGKPVFNSIDGQNMEPSILVLYDDYSMSEVKYNVESALNEFYAETGITGRVIRYEPRDWQKTLFDDMWFEVWNSNGYWANPPADWLMAVRKKSTGEYLAMGIFFMLMPGTTMADESKEHKLTCLNTVSQRVIVHELYRLAEL